MAITLITGTPGAGKTAYAVAEFERLREQSVKSGKPMRPVFVMGLDGLTLPHEVCPEVKDWTRQEPSEEDPTIEESVFTFPDGALIIIDEAQKVYRPRSASSKVPPVVAAFEKHRHHGLDFWLITQHPSLIDGNVKRLVGKHVHLRSHWAGRELLEWAEASEPNSRSDRMQAIRRRYRLPKRVFALYQSATVHVKQSRRLPIALWVFLVVVIVSGLLAWRGFGRVSQAMGGHSDIELFPGRDVKASGPGSHIREGVASQAPAGAAPVGVTMAEFVPRLKGRPESAPLYDGVRKVVAVPVVAGCVVMQDRCTCYTPQGTDADLDGPACRAWLKRPPFSPFRDVLPPPPASAQSQAPAPSAG